ncbi:MAG TPA: metallophosphoesterase [Beutenbergiaceae bacterium]|nr:metallophosphoesterase [Beutenbergiaceae bacterium]
MSRLAKRLLTGTLALGAGSLAWALFEARSYVLRTYELPLLPRGSGPIRVLHISDLHMGPGEREKIAWVRSLARHDPDLVITTGDNLSHPDGVAGVIEALSPLLHLPGVIVTGSNDFYLPVVKNPLRYFRKRLHAPVPSPRPQLPTHELLRGLGQGGWHHLDNGRASIDVAGALVDVVGTGDAHINLDRYPDPAPKAGVVHLGVTHAPYRRVLSAMVDDDVDLALAGHTHGGQVRLPGYGALVTNCDIDRRMARGLHQWPEPSAGARMWLHVSAGLGTSPFTPVRFACRPEASLITLTSR